MKDSRPNSSRVKLPNRGKNHVLGWVADQGRKLKIRLNHAKSFSQEHSSSLSDCKENFWWRRYGLIESALSYQKTTVYSSDETSFLSTLDSYNLRCSPRIGEINSSLEFHLLSFMKELRGEMLKNGLADLIFRWTCNIAQRLFPMCEEEDDGRSTEPATSALSLTLFNFLLNWNLFWLVPTKFSKIPETNSLRKLPNKNWRVPEKQGPNFFLRNTRRNHLDSHMNLRLSIVK